MLTGVVNPSREAIISLTVKSTSGKEHVFDAIVDTGFTGFLTLPTNVILQLGYMLTGHQQVILGDGSIQLVEVYTGIVEWDGQERLAEIDLAETEPLVGMSLLYGYRLTIETLDGGQVIIERL